MINLAAARNRAGMTQAQAGALINKTQSHFAKIEAGRVQLSAPDALTLCHAFGVDLSQLLTKES